MSQRKALSQKQTGSTPASAWSNADRSTLSRTRKIQNEADKNENPNTIKKPTKNPDKDLKIKIKTLVEPEISVK